MARIRPGLLIFKKSRSLGLVAIVLIPYYTKLAGQNKMKYELHFQNFRVRISFRFIF